MPAFNYQVAARWTSHKRGTAEGENIPAAINFAAPPEFGGEPGMWTPEHLLLASVSTCYLATLGAVAEASKLEFNSLQFTADGTVEKQVGGFRFTRIVLHPSVTIDKHEDRERVARLLEKAERVCLISRSLACPIALDAKIAVAEHANA